MPCQTNLGTKNTYKRQRIYFWSRHIESRDVTKNICNISQSMCVCVWCVLLYTTFVGILQVHVFTKRYVFRPLKTYIFYWYIYIIYYYRTNKVRKEISLVFWFTCVYWPVVCDVAKGFSFWYHNSEWNILCFLSLYTMLTDQFRTKIKCRFSRWVFF